MKTTVSSIKQFTALVVSLLLLTSFCDLQAQTVWTNAAGGDWNTAINWKPNTIPGVGTATYMTNGLPAYTVTYTGPMGAASIGSLTVTNVNTTTSNATLTVSASGFNVSGGITVGNGGVLNLNSGAVMNEAGTLTLNSGGQVNVAAGAVLTNSTLSISSGVYAQSGGNVTNSSVTPVGTGFAVVGGTFVDTTWNGSAGSSTGGKWFVTGAGTFVNFGNYTSSRTGGNGNPTQAAPNNNGLIISNGVVLFSSITFPGTVNGNYNSDSQINIWGGFVTNTGTFSMCEDNNRLSEFYQMGGTFANLNSSMVIGAAAAANIAATPFYLDVRGGTLLAQGVVLVAPGAPSGSGEVGNFFVTNTGTVYLGANGLTQNCTNGQSYSVQLGGSSTLGALANWTAGVGTNTINAKLTGGTGITLQAADASGNPYNITWNGVLSGTGNLYKTGGGILTLNGTNTFTGATVVSAGELAGITGGSISNTASVLVGAGATLGVQLASAGGQWTATNVIATNASTVDINLNGYSLTAAPLVVLGNLTTTNTLNFTVRGTVLGLGTYPLVKYTTQSGTLPANPYLVQNRAIGIISNDSVTTKTIYLVVTNTSAEPITWTVGTSNWDAGDLNWKDALGNAVAYQDIISDQVIFDDTASGTPPFVVTLTNTFSPGSITANLTNANYTISGAGGVITGTGSLTKTGTGTLTLTPSSAWSYSGGVTNAGGKIVLGSVLANNSACGTGPVTFNGGTLQQFDNGGTEAGPYTNAWVVPTGQTGTVLAAQRIGYTAPLSSSLTGGGTFNFNANGVRTIPTGDWTGFTGQVNIGSRSGTATLQWNTSKGIPNALVNLTNVTFTTWTSGQIIPLGAVMGTNANLTSGNAGGAGSATYVVGGLNTNSEYDGTISGGVTLRKVGTGAWTLTGNNTYTGSTAVSNGTLVVNGTITASPVTVYSGATLAGIGTLSSSVTLQAGSTVAPGGTNNYGTLIGNGGLIFNGGTNVVDISITNSDLLTVAGGLTITNGTVVLNISGALTNGIYPLISYDTLNGNVGSLALIPATAGSKSLSLITNNSQVQLQVSAIGNLNLTWASLGAGAVNGNWDIEVNANWLNGAALDIYDDGDNVTFNNTGATDNSLVTIPATVKPATVVVSGTLPYTFSGAGKISGAASLTMSSSSTLTLATFNDYSGFTLINNGTVQVGDGSTLGTSIGAGPVTNNSALVFNQPDSSSISSITGSGSLTVVTNVQLTVGNASYTGKTLVGYGKLEFGSGGASAYPATPFTVTNGGTIGFNLSGTLLLTNGVTGNGALSLDGPATVTLRNVPLVATNNYLQNTWVRNGTMILGQNEAIPSAGTVPGSTGWLVLDAGTLAAGTVDLNGYNQTVNAVAGLGGSVLGKITNSAAGTGTNVLTINTVVSAGFAGQIVDNTNSGRIALVVEGAGVQILSGANTYSGGTTVYGTLGIGQAASLGTGMTTLIGGTLSNTASFNLNTKNLTVATGNSGVLDMQPLGEMPNLYGGGILNVNITGTATGHNSNNYSDAPSSCVNFTGTLNCTGVVNNATMNLYFNGGSTAGDMQNATVNLDSLSVYGTCGSGGGTVQFGTLNLHANASIVGETYPANGTMLTCSIGALGVASDLEGTVSGPSAITKVGAGTLLMNGSDTYTGNTTVNGGSIVVGGSSFMASSPVITVAASAVLDVSAASPTFGATVPQTLAGFGAVAGNVTMENSTIIPGAAGTVGTLTFSNNLSLNGTVTNTFDIAGPGVNDQIAVVGTFDVSGGGNVFKLNALNPTLAPGTYTLVTFASSSTLPVGDISSLVTLAGSFAGQIRNLTLFNTGTSIQLQVGAGSTLTWAGDGTANLWDLTNSPDWNAGADIFYQNDSVTFDNTSSNLTVNLTGTLLPTAIIVSSDSNYVFTSSGKISGTTGIAKSGSGTLTITNSGGNNYTGPVTITAGTLKAGVATALGATNGATTVTNTGALDIGGQNLGAEPVTVSGNGSGSGAILNSGVAALNALQFVTLAGDTTFSGPGRWDIRTNSLGAYLNGNGYNLTKVGTNDTYLVNVGNANLNNVTISQGRIGVQNNTALGASGTLTLAAGAGLDLYDTTVTNTKAISLTNATISSTSSAYGANVLGGAISLNGIGTFTATTPLQLNGALTNSGGVLKLGASVLTLAGSSTYTGNTTISNGVLALVGTASITSSANLDVASGAVLDVSGLAGGLATLGSAQTLKGNGTVRGSVTVAANATVSPGESGIGTLTVTNVLTLAGNTAMDVNWTNAVKSDQIVAPTINLGGTLILNNLGTTLAAGNYFPLFSGSVSGSFASIVPATPGYGLAWDTSYLTVNGRLYVVAGVTVNTNAFSITNVVSGSSLNLSWPSDHQGWEVLIQTNSLTTGLSGTWFPLTDTTNNTTVSIPIDVKNGSVFIKMIYPPQ